MTSSAIRNWVFFALSSIWFSLARSYVHTYAGDDLIFAEVNSLNSIANWLPFSYYSVPYCKPMGGIRERVGNVGAGLMGDQIVNSPYRFRRNINKSIYLCTTDPLSEHEARLLKQRIRHLYQVNMMLDGLPAARYARHTQWTGFPIGFILPCSDDVYIINHLKFTVLVNEHRIRGYDIMDFDTPSVPKVYEPAPLFEIVGFTVVPCSVKHDQEYMKRLKMYDNIDSMECPSDLETLRVQRYSRILWFSVLHSLMTILLFTGIVFVIFLKTISREFAKRRGLDKQAKAHRPMRTLRVGSFLPAMHSGSRITRGFSVGYIGVRMWRTLKGSIDGWKSVSWSITFYFPGIVLIVHTALNLIMWVNHSIAAISISTYVTILLYWFCISAPVTLFGGLLATWAEAIQYPVKTNHIPREILAWTLPSWLLVLGAGMIPSIWVGRFYSMSGTLCVCLLSLVILCAETSLIVTYRNLQAEDWKWWWNYLVSDPYSLSGPPSVTVYVGYSLIMAIAALLSTGSIGFVALFYSLIMAIAVDFFRILSIARAPCFGKC
ncbi:hypothetical protein ACJRO7_000525 [Eucalyptus globulus]|uniref:Transmembrane 9 superfamily member n=1 Tax=Eucalyptus globulus TaxID=34317 RepID=A0ABD3LMV8_EUCGL